MSQQLIISSPETREKNGKSQQRNRSYKKEAKENYRTKNYRTKKYYNVKL